MGQTLKKSPATSSILHHVYTGADYHGLCQWTQIWSISVSSAVLANIVALSYLGCQPDSQTKERLKPGLSALLAAGGHTRQGHVPPPLPPSFKLPQHCMGAALVPPHHCTTYMGGWVAPFHLPIWLQALPLHNTRGSSGTVGCTEP